MVPAADDDAPEVLDLGVVDEPGDPEPPPGAGGGPQQGRVSRRALIALGGLVAAGAGLAVVRQQGSAPEAARTPSSSPSPSPSRLVPPTPAASRILPVEVTGLGGPLLGGPALDVFAIADAAVVRVELATGRMTRTSPPAGGLHDLLPVRGGVLVSGSSGQTALVPDGAEAREAAAALNASGVLLPSRDLDHVWVVEAVGDRLRMALVTVDGRRTGTTATLPKLTAGPPAPDGAGLMVVRGLGGIYAAGPQGISRITTGSLLAAGPAGWLVADCDDHAECGAAFVDRRGRRRPLAGVLQPDLAFGTAAYGDPAVGAISPDGRSAAVFSDAPDGSRPLLVLDLGRGTRVTTDLALTPETPSRSLAWSPDGRHVFAVDRAGRLAAVDPRTGGVRPLLPARVEATLPVLLHLAVRSQ